MSQEKDVRAPKDRDVVRRRYGMYINGNDDINHITSEILFNALDQCQEELADSVWMLTKKNNGKRWVLVANNGVSIPIRRGVEEWSKNQTQTEIAITKLHGGSKFHKDHILVGMNGVGASVTNFLSEDFIVLSKVQNQDSIDKLPDHLKNQGAEIGKYYYLRFKKGLKEEEGFTTVKDYAILNKFGFQKDYGESWWNEAEWNTVVIFSPDMSIFETSDLKSPSYVKFVKYLAKRAGKNITVNLNGKPFGDNVFNYQYESSIKVESDKDAPEDDTVIYNPFVEFLFAFNLNEDFNSQKIISSVNGIESEGYHVRLLTQAFNEALDEFLGWDTQGYGVYGLDLMVICSCLEPGFDSQNKSRLKNIAGITRGHIIEELKGQFIRVFNCYRERFNQYGDALWEYIESFNKASRLSTIKDAINIADGSKQSRRRLVPAKLIDCDTQDRKQAELFLVEGDSAKGGLMGPMGRDPMIHAILPARGKIKNVVGMDVSDLVNYDTCMDIINAMQTGISDMNNITYARYGKLILASDADSDGYHINALKLGLISTHMNHLIKAGMVYILESPLYRNNETGEYYYYGDEAKLKDIPEGCLSRFKGLGEIPEEQVYDIFFNPKTRHLIQVTMKDYATAYDFLTNSDRRKEISTELGILDENHYLKSSEIDYDNIRPYNEDL